MNRPIIAIAALLLLMAMPASAWDTEFVAYDGGTHSSIKVGPLAQLHISYSGGTGVLKYAFNGGSGWTTEVVDPAAVTGLCTSLALDSSGNPHIAYVNYTGRSIGHASKSGASWTISYFDTEEDHDFYPSLAIDSLDRAHIAYWDGEYETNDLSYATQDSSGWAVTTVDTQGHVGRAPSIAVDSLGHPHIAYYDETNSTLKYATFDGAQWIVSTLESVETVAFNFKTALAIDSQDRIHVVYSAYHLVGTDWCGRLRYAMHDGDGWHFSTIQQAAPTRDFRLPSISIDDNDDVHVAYLLYYNVEAYSPEVWYAWLDSTGWHFEFVAYDNPDSGNSLGVSADSQGRPHLCYAFGFSALKHATREAPAAIADRISAASEPVLILRPLAPNPTRGASVMSFVLPRTSEVSLDVFDASGRLSASTPLGVFNAGEHAVELDAPLPAGVYLVRLRAGSLTETQKLIVR